MSRSRAAAIQDRRPAIAAAEPKNRHRETLSRERVLQAAAALADEAGIAGLSMRKLGQALGVEAASLYNHVSGKDDLLDGLVELLVSRIAASDGADWKAALRADALSLRALFTRHPWAAALMDSRPGKGPYFLSRVDRLLGSLIGAGFPPRDAANATLIVNSYVFGFERQRPTPAAQGDAVGTREAHEALARMAGGAYPNAVRVAGEFSRTLFDADAAFALGLGFILDGLEGSLQRARARPRPGFPVVEGFKNLSYHVNRSARTRISVTTRRIR
jgi:AcrR family transcriptional regulator